MRIAPYVIASAALLILAACTVAAGGAYLGWSMPRCENGVLSCEKRGPREYNVCRFENGVVLAFPTWSSPGGWINVRVGTIEDLQVAKCLVGSRFRAERWVGTSGCGRLGGIKVVRSVRILNRVVSGVWKPISSTLHWLRWSVIADSSQTASPSRVVVSVVLPYPGRRRSSQLDRR
jgi:hypothetical protein